MLLNEDSEYEKSRHIFRSIPSTGDTHLSIDRSEALPPKALILTPFNWKTKLLISNERILSEVDMRKITSVSSGCKLQWVNRCNVL